MKSNLKNVQKPMPANSFNSFTNYGVGIGLRVPHYQHILAKKPVVDWFEIISENFMVDGGRPLEVLDSILEQYRVVQHGVAIGPPACSPPPTNLQRSKVSANCGSLPQRSLSCEVSRNGGVT